MLLHKIEWEPIRMSAFEIVFFCEKDKSSHKAPNPNNQIFHMLDKMQKKGTGTANSKLILQLLMFKSEL